MQHFLIYYISTFKPRGFIYFEHIWVVVLVVGEGEGGLFNLAKMMISALHNELECKVEKLKYKKLKSCSQGSSQQIHTSTLWINHPRSVHTKFYSGDWLMQSNILLVSNNKGRWGGADLLSSSEKGGLIRERGLNRGFMLLKVLDRSFVLLEHYFHRKRMLYNTGF